MPMHWLNDAKTSSQRSTTCRFRLDSGTVFESADKQERLVVSSKLTSTKTMVQAIQFMRICANIAK